MKDIVKMVVNPVLQTLPGATRTRVKEWAEVQYWKRVLKQSGGTFYNGHFEKRYTELFNLPREHFAGKRMLDVGCGPLGSLEWADDASRRVGADPLAAQYMELNAGQQEMEYVAAGGEDLPFEDGAFDVVSCFNALDHVEDVPRSVAELERVLAPGGDLLLIVEIDHEPTVTEPHRLRTSIVDDFAQCVVITSDVFAIRDDHDVYASLREAKPRAKPTDPAILCARLQKVSERN